MSSITFLPDNRKKEVKGNETILRIAQRAKIPLVHVCRGHARCSTCRVHIVEGFEHVSPRTHLEQVIADQMALGSEIRLACQTRVTGDVKVRRLVLDESDIELTSLLIQDPRSNQVSVEKKVLILFSDIRGFTPMIETLLPYDVIHILNRYFHIMNKVVTKHGGQINNYLGDGFMALFDIKPTEKYVLRGIRAGLEMLDMVEKRIKPYVRRFFGRDFRIGIGLHYGLVVAGTIGALDNKKKTVIGDAVNFAQRIEASNKRLGTQFLISEDVFALIQNRIRVNRTFTITIPGKTGKYTIYEVVG